MADSPAPIPALLSVEDRVAFSGPDYAWLASPLTDPWNIALFGCVLAFVASLVYASTHVHRLRDRIRFFRGRARSYQEFTAITLRLSLGIAFLGAGSQHHLLAPAVGGQPSFAALQVLLGLLLIAGLGTAPVALCALALTVGATILHPELIQHLEVIGALVAVILLGQAKPSLDDLLGFSLPTIPEAAKSWVPVALRIGVGIPLVFTAIAHTLFNPHVIGVFIERIGVALYLPLSTNMWVLSIFLVQLGLGIAFLLGLHVRMLSLLAFFLLNLVFFFYGKEVYTHAVLLGTLFVLMAAGAGPYSLDDYYAKQRQR